MKKLSYLIVLALILGLVLTGCTLLSNIGQVPTTGQKRMPLSTANLVALWHLDGNANDSTGNGNDGIIYGTSWVDGKLGKALSFDVSGDYVDCGSNVGSFNLSNPFTIEAWINPAFGNTDVIYGNAWAEPGYHVRVTSGNRVRFILITNGSNYKGIDSSVLTAGWHHIAAVWDGTSVKIYVDGAENSQIPIESGTVSTITTAANTKIGLDTAAAAHYFNGIIDEVRIWDGALTADEILYSYADETLHVDDDWVQWPGAYKTINEALAVAGDGDTIIVHAGTYTPSSTIIIDKDNLTLVGPQAGVDPRPSYGSTRTPGSAEEAVIDGQNVLDNIILIDANYVVINGFEVKSGQLDLIKQDVSCKDTAIKYNIVHDSVQDEGIQLKECTDGVIEYNYVYDIAGDALNFAYSQNCTIQFNEVHDADVRTVATWGGAIYTYDSDNIDIIGNLIYETRSHGIVYGGAVKNYNTYNPNFMNSGGKVEGNIVHDVDGDGLVLLSYNTMVKDNEIYGCIRGIQIIGADISIQYNDLYNNEVGISVEDIGMISSVNISAHCNNIEGNTEYGIINTTTTTVDATHNWWGHATGPHDNSNDTGTGGLYNLDGLGDAVSDYVDYRFWAYIPDFCDCEAKTIGYWKNHPNYVEGILEALRLLHDDIVVGTGKIVGTDVLAEDIFKKPHSKTYSMLAAQLLAAKLNVAQLSHFIPGYNSDCMDDTIEDADIELEPVANYNTVRVPKEDKDDVNSIKDELDDFNNNINVECPLSEWCPCECD